MGFSSWLTPALLFASQIGPVRSNGPAQCEIQFLACSSGQTNTLAGGPCRAPHCSQSIEGRAKSWRRVTELKAADLVEINRRCAG
jgi:hypothetical protein